MLGNFFKTLKDKKETGQEIGPKIVTLLKDGEERTVKKIAEELSISKEQVFDGLYNIIEILTIRTDEVDKLKYYSIKPKKNHTEQTENDTFKGVNEILGK